MTRCFSCGAAETDGAVIVWHLGLGSEDVPLCDDCRPVTPRAPLPMASADPWSSQSRRDEEMDREVARDFEQRHQREQR